jgi:hypothetical protein
MNDLEWELKIRKLERALAWGCAFGLVTVAHGLLTGWLQ